MNHARRSDPEGSELAVASICADTSYADLILWAVHRMDGPTTDDDVLALIETRTSRRFQRSVLARARGRLETDGALERIPPVIGRTGRPTVTYRLPGPTQLRLI